MCHIPALALEIASCPILPVATPPSLVSKAPEKKKDSPRFSTAPFDGMLVNRNSKSGGHEVTRTSVHRLFWVSSTVWLMTRINGWCGLPLECLLLPQREPLILREHYHFSRSIPTNIFWPSESWLSADRTFRQRSLMVRYPPSIAKIEGALFGFISHETGWLLSFSDGPVSIYLIPTNW